MDRKPQVAVAPVHVVALEAADAMDMKEDSNGKSNNNNNSCKRVARSSSLAKNDNNINEASNVSDVAVKLEPTDDDDDDDDDDNDADDGDQKPAAKKSLLDSDVRKEALPVVSSTATTTASSSSCMTAATTAASSTAALVASTSAAAAAAAALDNEEPKKKYNDDDDDTTDEEVEFVKSTGVNALSDFPHSREHCVVIPFVLTGDTVRNQEYCPNCYCYVCDTVVTDCPEWSDHCHARHDEHKWQQLRNQKKPATLLPYNSSRYSYPTVDSMMQAATRVYPQEVTPPSALIPTTLKHYQKQSLAFMLHVENTYRIKSGYLCSEVGMGKTAMMIALMAMNPMPDPPSIEDVKQAQFQKKNEAMLYVKSTVVFTSKTLMGQWIDEIHKHAPSLTVVQHHPPSGRKLKLVDLATADVVVTTPTKEFSRLFQDNFHYWRVIVDESHLLGKQGHYRLGVVGR
jgi:SNF2-related domain